MPTLTLHAHSGALAGELSKVQPVKVHSCEYCSEISIKLWDSASKYQVDLGKQEFWINGLTEELFKAAAASKYVLFRRAQPRHYDLLFETHPQYIYRYQSDKGTTFERRFRLRVTQGGDETYKSFYARIEPCYFDDDTVTPNNFIFETLNLTLDEGKYSQKLRKVAILTS